MNLSDKIRSLGLGRLMTGLAAFQSELSGVKERARGVENLHARDKQRAKSISSADTSGVLSWQVQTKSLQVAYGVPYGFLFLDLVRWN